MTKKNKQIHWDSAVVEYTSRRIKEMSSGRSSIYSDDRLPVHPYIRRRLDEIKKERSKNPTEDS